MGDGSTTPRSENRSSMGGDLRDGADVVIKMELQVSSFVCDPSIILICRRFYVPMQVMFELAHFFKAHSATLKQFLSV